MADTSKKSPKSSKSKVPEIQFDKVPSREEYYAVLSAVLELGECFDHAITELHGSKQFQKMFGAMSKRTQGVYKQIKAKADSQREARRLAEKAIANAKKSGV